MARDTKNVKLGVCSVAFDGKDLGFTQGGVEVMVSTDTHEVEVDQFGKTVVNEIIMKRDVKVKVPLAETTLENLVNIMPGAVLVSDGAKATGSITVATQPTNGQTILVNGKTITFKTAAVTPYDVTIGANAAATAANLAAVLNASTDLAISQAGYSVAGAVVTVTYDNRGVEGNAFTIATGTAGASVTVSGATLTGGVAVTKARVDVSTGVGTSLLDIARKLVLHPTDNAENDFSEDFVIPLAATAGALQFSYEVDKERTFPVEFTGYPDAAGKLFYVGDQSAV
jgi:hypothetical protein